MFPRYTIVPHSCLKPVIMSQVRRTLLNTKLKINTACTIFRMTIFSKFRMSFQISFGICILCWTSLPAYQFAEAVTAYPNPILFKEDGGRVEFQLLLRGDEIDNWYTDLDGYTVVENEKGEMVYAIEEIEIADMLATSKASGRLQASGTRVIYGNRPSGVQKNLRPSKDAFKNDCRAKNKLCAKKYSARRSRRLGNGTSSFSEKRTVKNLVIPMRFYDHRDRQLPTKEHLETLFNSPTGHHKLCPSGSVKQIFLENSYGALELESTVLNWVDLPKTEEYYANGQSGLDITFHEAIRKALDIVDNRKRKKFFTKFDSDENLQIDVITFLHSGYGAEWGDGESSGGVKRKNRIWSHNWELSSSWTSKSGVQASAYHVSSALWGGSGNTIGRIGVLAHEIGHYFGLPDLYDRGAGSGIGSFCLMANSWGFDGSQYYPPMMSAYSKIMLGWDTPRTISDSGVYTIGATAIKKGEIYKISDGYSAGEYFLIENRQPVSFDGRIPLGEGGLVIYHVDEFNFYDYAAGWPGQSGWPANNYHYRVAVLPQDGRYDLEQGIGTGDAGDFWSNNPTGLQPSLNTTAGPFPNSDAYQHGNVVKGKFAITEISKSGTNMTFRVTFPDPTAIEAPFPTRPPQVTPAGAPAGIPSTQKPTLRPTISFCDGLRKRNCKRRSGCAFVYASASCQFFGSKTCSRWKVRCRRHSDCCSGKCKNSIGKCR